MIATADEFALCAAIREQPEEDTPRLMLADLLDECGDASRPLRAELIRLQIGNEGVPLSRSPDMSYREWKAREERIDELAARLARDHPELYPPCPASYGTPEGVTLHNTRGLRCGVCEGAGRVGSWERGLLSVPVPTLAAVWEREMLDPRLGLGPRLDQYTTPYGDWQLTPWARDELLTRPWVAEVPVADREPFEDMHGRTVGWQRRSRAEKAWYGSVPDARERYAIHDFLFDLLPGNETNNDACKRFPTAAAAKLALARCVARAAFAPGVAAAAPGG